MMRLITREDAVANNDWSDIHELGRLRKRVFADRLKWDVKCRDGMEEDDFDCVPEVRYLAYEPTPGEIVGCIRFLPTTGPTMLADVFGILSENDPPSSSLIWESSRFSLDVEKAEQSDAGIAKATHILFSGMIEFGLTYGLTKIVTVTDTRVERILRRSRWELDRIGDVHRLGNTKAVAGYLEVSNTAFNAVQKAGGLDGPVLTSHQTDIASVG